jgi:hypothetical protein
MNTSISNQRGHLARQGAIRGKRSYRVEVHICHHNAASGLRHANHLCDGGFSVRDIKKHSFHSSSVEDGILIRQPIRNAGPKAYILPAASSCSGLSNHYLADIDSLDIAFFRHKVGQLYCRSSMAAPGPPTPRSEVSNHFPCALHRRNRCH